jgi:hypothetical protein
MSQNEPSTVGDIEGPWVEPAFKSGLIERCRSGWDTPVVDLSNWYLSMYLRQRLGLALTIPEAESRLSSGFVDGTELYDEELMEALNHARGKK